jgi:sugar/nucleoside kinase (ribokinase family)
MEYSFYGPESGKRLVLISPQDLPARDLAASRLVALGGVGLSHPESAEATLQAARYAAEGRALVAFDPNWRPTLWHDPAGWAATVRQVLPYVDVLKVSRGEMALLSEARGSIGRNGEVNSPTDALACMAAEGRQPRKPLLIAVTMGGQGAAYAFYSDPQAMDRPDHLDSVEPFTVEIVDPTGAGDSFLAGLLVGLLDAFPPGDTKRIERIDLLALRPSQFHYITRFANATGALATTRRGAMRGLPTRRAVERLLTSAYTKVASY